MNHIKVPRGANRGRRVKGRGQGTGHGARCGRGNKGQNARAGGGVRIGFEGGQMPLYRRLPKRGFNNKFRKDWIVLNVRDLNQFDDGSEVSPQLLIESGLVKHSRDGLRILGEGEVEKKLTVRAHHFSASAKAKIEAAGGSVEVLS